MRTILSQPKLHSGHIEVAVAQLLDWRRYVLVPNVSWGLHLGHECDLLCLDESNRFTEIEIKISAADLRRDFAKGHGHRSKYIGRLVYAVPKNLQNLTLELVPAGTGVIVVEWNLRSGKYVATWVKKCRHNPKTAPLPAAVIDKYFRLAAMRIWSLKIARLDKQNQPRTK